MTKGQKIQARALGLHYPKVLLNYMVALLKFQAKLENKATADLPSLPLNCQH